VAEELHQRCRVLVVAELRHDDQLEHVVVLRSRSVDRWDGRGIEVQVDQQRAGSALYDLGDGREVVGRGAGDPVPAHGAGGLRQVRPGELGERGGQTPTFQLDVLGAVGAVVVDDQYQVQPVPHGGVELGD